MYLVSRSWTVIPFGAVRTKKWAVYASLSTQSYKQTNKIINLFPALRVRPICLQHVNRCPTSNSTFVSFSYGAKFSKWSKFSYGAKFPKWWFLGSLMLNRDYSWGTLQQQNTIFVREKADFLQLTFQARSRLNAPAEQFSLHCSLSSTHLWVTWPCSVSLHLDDRQIVRHNRS